MTELRRGSQRNAFDHGMHYRERTFTGDNGPMPHAHTVIALPKDPSRPLRVQTSAATYTDLEAAVDAANREQAIDFSPAFRAPQGYAFGWLRPTKTAKRVLAVHPASATHDDIRLALEDSMRRAAVIGSAILAVAADQLPQEAS